MSAEDGSGFTLKEIVLDMRREMREGFDQVKELRRDLDGKASHATVERLESRIERLERDRDDRNAVARANSAMFSKREKIAGLLALVASIAVQFLFHYGGH